MQSKLNKIVRNMRRTISILLFLLLSQTINAFETLIDGLKYNLNFESKTAEVVSNYHKYEGDIIVPSNVTFENDDYTVTSIGNKAFYSCYGLLSITIPNSVTKIGVDAFCGCICLTSITIPKGITSIGDNAFSRCTGLTSIYIPNSVIYIGWNPFRECSGLISIVVDEGNLVFDSRNNCNAIIETNTNTIVSGCKNTIIHEGVNSIGAYAFSGCGDLVSISIPNSVTTISIGAFENCVNLKSITIPNAVAYIETSVFYGCSGLTAISIPQNVTGIGEYAFYGCSSLSAITIPSSVMRIDSYAFSGCSNLSTIRVNEENPEYDSRDNCNAIIATNTNVLVAGCSQTIIPNSVIGIGKGAFNNSSITSIVIPKNITRIGDFAFYGCSDLTSIIVEEGNPIYDSRSNCNAIIDTKTNTLIVGCIKTVIPDNVTDIGDYSFSGNRNITTIYIPKNIKSIGLAFSGCENLLSLTIEDFFENKYQSTRAICTDLYGTGRFDIILRVPQEKINLFKANYPWSEYTIVPMSTQLDCDISLPYEDYCTFYRSDFNYFMPYGLMAMVVEGITDGKLKYRTIALGDSSRVIPAGVPVIIKRTDGVDRTYTLNACVKEATYQGDNLLCGSDVDTLTFAGSSSLFYKLSYGPSGTDLSDAYGWYWGAPDGAAFNIEGHKAWLAIPHSIGSKAVGCYSIDGTTAVLSRKKNNDSSKTIYGMDGRLITNPINRGVYIIDGKKVMINE